MKATHGRNIARNGTGRKPAPKSAADRCAREVMESVPVVMRYLRREIRRQGAAFLSVPQLRTLAFLSFSPDSSLAGVAEHLGVTPPTASAIVNRLVQQGLVSRAGHPRERRCIVLALTKPGAQRLHHVRRATCSIMAKVLADRSPEELRKIVEGMTVLGTVFKEMVGQNGH